jgi:hypothetical protein
MATAEVAKNENDHLSRPVGGGACESHTPEYANVVPVVQ